MTLRPLLAVGLIVAGFLAGTLILAAIRILLVAGRAVFG